MRDDLDECAAVTMGGSNCTLNIFICIGFSPDGSTYILGRENKCFHFFFTVQVKDVLGSKFLLFNQARKFPCAQSHLTQECVSPGLGQLSAGPALLSLDAEACPLLCSLELPGPLEPFQGHSALLRNSPSDMCQKYLIPSSGSSSLPRQKATLGIQNCLKLPSGRQQMVQKVQVCYLTSALSSLLIITVLSFFLLFCLTKMYKYCV